MSNMDTPASEETLNQACGRVLKEMATPANGYMNADCPKCGKLNMINPPHDCTPANGWREEIMKPFIDKYDPVGSGIDNVHYWWIRSYFEKVLDQHFARLVERIGGLKKKTELDRSSLAVGMQEYWHNQALDQVIDIVKDI